MSGWFGPLYGPVAELLQDSLELLPLFGQGVLDSWRALRIDFAGDDPLTVQLSQPFREAGRAYALDPALEFVEPRRFLQSQSMNDRQGPDLRQLIPRAMNYFTRVQDLLIDLYGLAQVKITYLELRDY